MAESLYIYLVVAIDINGEGTPILACELEADAAEIAKKIGGRVERVPVLVAADTQ